MGRAKTSQLRFAQSSSFQDFVFVHELLHLRVPNHGKLFKALMKAHLPDTHSHDTSRLQRRT